jgi:hydroxylamine dehydrogenase
MSRAMPQEAVACIECHKQENPGMFADWAASGHAKSGITCLDCHLADPTDKDISKIHAKVYEQGNSKWANKQYFVPISAVVSPKDCSRCHPDETQHYSKSKHANTIEIMWKIDNWLNQGMNSDLERKVGCLTCHGTVIKLTDKRGTCRKGFLIDLYIVSVVGAESISALKFLFLQVPQRRN